MKERTLQIPLSKNNSKIYLHLFFFILVVLLVILCLSLSGFGIAALAGSAIAIKFFIALGATAITQAAWSTAFLGIPGLFGLILGGWSLNNILQKITNGFKRLTEDETQTNMAGETASTPTSQTPPQPAQTTGNQPNAYGNEPLKTPAPAKTSSVNSTILFAFDFDLTLTKKFTNNWSVNRKKEAITNNDVLKQPVVETLTQILANGHQLAIVTRNHDGDFVRKSIREAFIASGKDGHLVNGIVIKHPPKRVTSQYPYEKIANLEEAVAQSNPKITELYYYDDDKDFIEQYCKPSSRLPQVKTTWTHVEGRDQAGENVGFLLDVQETLRDLKKTPALVI